MHTGINGSLWRKTAISTLTDSGDRRGERLREREDICSTCVEGGYGGWWVGGFERHHERNLGRSKEQLLAPSAQDWLPSSLIFLRGSQGDVVYLGWPIALLRGLSQLVQLFTWSPINFGDLTPYLTYGLSTLRRLSSISATLSSVDKITNFWVLTTPLINKIDL